MPHYLKAKIKDRDQFKHVFPLPIDGDNNFAKFIRSILGRTVRVRKFESQNGRFHFLSNVDPRFVIMPNWIEYFDSEELVPAGSAEEACIGLVVYWDGTVIVLGR